MMPAALPHRAAIAAPQFDRDAIARYDVSGPRYTSYPTAPHFDESIGPDVYAGWLGRLTAENRLSLYAHIPYCDRLCWFCDCHTKQTLRYEPVADYLALAALKKAKTPSA